MKVKEGFRMRKLGRDHIVVGEGLKQINFNKMIVLNDTAAFLWESIADKEFTKDDLTELLVNNYDVDAEVAAKDASALADKWLETGIIEA